MPLILIQSDITTLRCDAIVNAANNSLLGGGGVDGAIHRAAGPELLAECRTLGGCETGKAKLTKGYRLPAKYVIHTVGHIWRGGEYGEPALLRSCFLESLQLAVDTGCESVAFPLISSGVYGYPKQDAIRVARETILEFLREHEMTVYLVFFRRSELRLEEELQQELTKYIDVALPRAKHFTYNLQGEAKASAPLFTAARPAAKLPAAEDVQHGWLPAGAAASEPGLDEALSQLDESFSQMLLRKIDERGMTDAACYKKANVDRKLFSKIRGDVHYKPSKVTAIAFALALELPMAETEELLRKAGYALSGSSRFDLIISFFIRRGNYNIFDINEALFAYDQPLLGG